MVVRPETATTHPAAGRSYVLTLAGIDDDAKRHRDLDFITGTVSSWPWTGAHVIDGNQLDRYCISTAGLPSRSTYPDR